MKAPKSLTKNIIIISAIFAAALCFLAYENYQSAGLRLENLYQNREVVMASENFTSAAQAFGLERNSTYFSLNRKIVKFPDQRENIAKWRETADNSFRKSLSNIEKLDFAAKQEQISGITALYKDIVQIRQLADNELNKPLNNRDEKLGEKLVSRINRLINAMQNLNISASLALESVDTPSSQMLSMNWHLWTMAETTSREVAIISSEITSEEPTAPEKLDMMNYFAGRVAYAWEMVKKSAFHIGEGEFKLKLDEAKNTYFVAYMDAFSVLMANKLNEPEGFVGTAEFINLSDNALQAVYELQDLLFSDIRKNLSAQIAVAKDAYFVSIVGITLAALYSLLASLYLVFRVARPHNKALQVALSEDKQSEDKQSEDKQEVDESVIEAQTSDEIAEEVPEAIEKAEIFEAAESVQDYSLDDFIKSAKLQNIEYDAFRERIKNLSQDVRNSAKHLSESTKFMLITAENSAAKSLEINVKTHATAETVVNLSSATELIIRKSENVLDIASSLAMSLGGADESSVPMAEDYKEQIMVAVNEQAATTGKISGKIRAAADGIIASCNDIEAISTASIKNKDAAQNVHESSRKLAKDAENLFAEFEKFLNELETAKNEAAA